MEINQKCNGSEYVLTVTGRLDTMTSPSLEAALSKCLENAGKLIFDFSGLEYISSMGLRVLFAAQKKMGARGGMVVRHVNEEVMEVFEVTGFADILTIE